MQSFKNYGTENLFIKFILFAGFRKIISFEQLFQCKGNFEDVRIFTTTIGKYFLETGIFSFIDGPRGSLRRLRSQLAEDGCPESQVVLAKQLLEEQCGEHSKIILYRNSFSYCLHYFLSKKN